MSQGKMGEVLGFSQQTIAKWEKGKASPDPGVIVSIADMFDVSADYLLGRTDRRMTTPAPIPDPTTLAAHETEDAMSVSDERMEEIIAQAYHLIMAKKRGGG